MSKDSSSVDEKGGLPLVWRVQVSEFRSGAPWPVTTIDLREDGHVLVNGPVGATYEALFRATRKATVMLAMQSMEETIRADLATGRKAGPGAQGAGDHALAGAATDQAKEERQ